MKRTFTRAILAGALFATLSGCVSQNYTDTKSEAKAVQETISAYTPSARLNNVITINRPPIDLTPVNVVEPIDWLDKPSNVKIKRLPLSELLNVMLTNENIDVKFLEEANPDLLVKVDASGTRKMVLNRLSQETGYAFIPSNDALTVQKFVSDTFIINIPTGDYSGQLGSQGEGGGEDDKKIEGQFINVAYEGVNVVNDLSNAIKVLLKAPKGDKDDKNDKLIGSVDAITSLSTITVRTTAKRMVAVKQLIDTHQALLAKQTLLSIRILEFKSNDGEDNGIDWEVLKDIGKGTLKFSLPGSSIGSPASNSGLAFEATGSWNGTKAFIKALKQQGTVSTQTPISMLALNSQPVRISQSMVTPFLSDIVTVVTDTSTSTTTTRDKVTEGIDMMAVANVKDNFVWLRVAGKLSKIADDREIETAGIKQRYISTRDVDLNFTNKLRYGQTVILGSIKQHTTSANKSASFRVEGLGSQVTNREVVETLVLLTPRKIQ
ncbi:type II and III secretion system protein [Moritella viscosa]|uniref:Type II and III secretion system protein n=1 Tax=Moritella viscosa TaxID=80854 RepID=A0ABY1HIH2_9GAMM|nr:type II and III secretion system protein [Moritella viscosa]SGZ00291.1 Putative uncharacterized protein [Moritella viscosa]